MESAPDPRASADREQVDVRDAQQHAELPPRRAQATQLVVVVHHLSMWLPELR